MVQADAPCGDILNAGPAKREKNGLCDLGLVANANAAVSQCQPGIFFRCHRICDRRHNAKAG
ncbi:hypothetical protein SDC9_196915 [bioreactor metagenome]|uniref:Uncharacterized protein n=1 Tax=bioreactor metagenome TaxID=1076179 RepID=A0A645IDB1_9ZZZZ